MYEHVLVVQYLHTYIYCCLYAEINNLASHYYQMVQVSLQNNKQKQGQFG